MRRRHRDAPMACYLDNGGGGGLSRESVNGLQSYDLVSHGADNAPTARCGTRRHRHRTRQLDPQRHRKLRRAEEV